MKNSVFYSDVNTKKWLRAAAVRAIKTVAQTVLAMIPTAVAINAIDWRAVLATAATAGVLSIATSLAGIPEVPAESEADSEEDSKADSAAGKEAGSKAGKE